MGIEAFVTSKCVETCVYWGSPVNDGFGGFTFDDPVEIACRWQETEQLLSPNIGTEDIILSRASVFVVQDLDEGGYLYYGTLSELSDEEQSNPKLIDKAYLIKRFERIPALGSKTEFVRKAYLTPYLR